MATSRPCLLIVPLCGLLTYQPTSEKHVGGVNVISYLGHFSEVFLLRQWMLSGGGKSVQFSTFGREIPFETNASAMCHFYYSRYFTGVASGIRPCTTEVYGPTLPTELSGRRMRYPDALGLSGRPCDHDADAPVQSERP